MAFLVYSNYIVVQVPQCLTEGGEHLEDGAAGEGGEGGGGGGGALDHGAPAPHTGKMVISQYTPKVN